MGRRAGRELKEKSQRGGGRQKERQEKEEKGGVAGEVDRQEREGLGER